MRMHRCWTWMRRWFTARWTAVTSRTSASQWPSTGGNTACTCAGGPTCSNSWTAVRSSSRSSSSPPPRRSTPSSSSTSSTPPGLCCPAHLLLFTYCILSRVSRASAPDHMYQTSWDVQVIQSLDVAHYSAHIQFKMPCDP